MNHTELDKAVHQIQALVGAQTGKRLGIEGEAALGAILRRLASRNWSGTDEFHSEELTILLADIRGFTSLAEGYPAGTVLEMVNRCLISLGTVVASHEGVIDKFMGDSIMVLFSPRGRSDDAVKHAVERAVHCAVDMQRSMDGLNSHFKANGLPELYLGIGLNTGPVVAGTLGSDFYSAYTVIGHEVNLASRIEGFSLRGQILVSEATFERCRGFVGASERMVVHVKGSREPVALREVLEIPSLGKSVPRREIRKSPRVRANLDFSYQVIEGKVAVPQRHAGTVMDIGYHGLFAQLRRPGELLQEVKLELALPLVDYRAQDLYGRIVKREERGESHLCGIEFTSAGAATAEKIRQFVQLLLQGAEAT